MGKLMKFAVAVLIAAAIIYFIRSDKLNPASSYDGDNPDGKLLGVVPDKPGFGAHEIVSGALVVGGLWAAAAALRHVPILKKYTPATQAPV